MRQFVLGAGVAAIVTCVILGASALANDGANAPAISSSLRVVGVDPNSGNSIAPLPSATTPESRHAPGHKVGAKAHHARTTSPTKRSVTNSSTHTKPPRPPRPRGVRGRGVVFVTAVAGFDDAILKGTGMLMSSDGDILTNNHVVRGGTSFKITDAATGKTYRADVVGTDPSADVAVIHVRHVAGLPVASFGNSSDVAGTAVHDRVTAVGNAGGRGTLRTVRGKVTGLSRTVTARSEAGTSRERLTGMIQTSARAVGGDSGGPLYDSTSHIIGMVTAGSAGSSGAVRSYAIPITRARTIADRIVAGHASAQIHIGVPAITGVAVLDSARGGAYVKAVVRGGPAYRAGVTPGSVIIGVGGVRVTSVRSMHAQVGRYRPGQRTSLTWVDPYGAGHTAVITLARGPAD